MLPQGLLCVWFPQLELIRFQCDWPMFITVLSYGNLMITGDGDGALGCLTTYVATVVVTSLFVVALEAT